MDIIFYIWIFNIVILDEHKLNILARRDNAMRISIPSNNERNRQASIRGSVMKNTGNRHDSAVTKKTKPSNRTNRNHQHNDDPTLVKTSKSSKATNIKNNTLPQHSDEPSHNNRHSWFKVRIVAFTVCFFVLTAFVLSSFLLGYDNGKSVVGMSQAVVNGTIVPICDALSHSVPSERMSGVFNGLSRLMTIDAMSVFVSIFIISVLIAILVSFGVLLIGTIRSRRDSGNVSMMRGYQQRYEMYKKIS